MNRSQFQSEMEHISSGQYFLARQIQAHKVIMSTILEHEQVDDVSLDELSMSLNEIGEFSDALSCLADDVVRVCNTYKGVLQA